MATQFMSPTARSVKIASRWPGGRPSDYRVCCSKNNFGRAIGQATTRWSASRPQQVNSNVWLL